MTSENGRTSQRQPRVDHFLEPGRHNCFQHVIVDRPAVEWYRIRSSGSPVRSSVRTCAGESLELDCFVFESERLSHVPRSGILRRGSVEGIVAQAKYLVRTAAQWVSTGEVANRFLAIDSADLLEIGSHQAQSDAKLLLSSSGFGSVDLQAADPSIIEIAFNTGFPRIRRFGAGSGSHIDHH